MSTDPPAAPQHLQLGEDVVAAPPPILADIHDGPVVVWAVVIQAPVFGLDFVAHSLWASWSLAERERADLIAWKATQEAGVPDEAICVIPWRVDATWTPAEGRNA